MKVIANIKDGFLIEATTDEVKEILRSVQGSVPKDILIGQKIPAIDYASTITKLKKLPDEYNYKLLISEAKKFNEGILELDKTVNQLSESDL